MDWKNQFTRTPYIVLFVVLATVGISTAYALMTITLAGDVIIEGDTKMDGNLKLDGAHSGINWNSRVPKNNVITTVDSDGNVGQYTSITLGSDGLPVISYHDPVKGDLLIAKCNSPICDIPMITTVDSSGNVGKFTSIAIGTDGNPVISYYLGSSIGNLKVAKCDNPACTASTINTVDSTDDVGQYSSIAIGLDGFPVISYYDVTNGDLDVAKCDDASCSSATITVLDSTDVVGLYTSIAIMITGNPVISYYDSDNDLLKLKSCNNPSCTSANTLPGPTNGQHTSITIGEDGVPIVSYSKFGSLFTIRCTGIICSGFDPLPQQIDATSLTTIEGISITIGVDGNPMISYYHGSNNELRVAKCYDPECAIVRVAIVDSSGDMGKFSSIVIGTDGLPIISYRDISNLNLKVAKCGNILCEPNWTRR